MGTGSLPDLPAKRASDDDRQQVITRLRDAAGNGVLGLDELEERIGAVYGAKTLPELADLTADLPAPRADPPAEDAGPTPRRPSVPAMKDAEFQQHLAGYASTMVLLVVIWALTNFGGFFWPGIPAAAWGIGLVSHFVAANRGQAEIETRPDDPNALSSGRPGAPSAAEPPRGVERRSTRFVVAMFVDVVGSTGLNEALGDDGWVRVRDRVRSLLGECFDREGGYEVNTAGDGVLARFDEPGRAVHAAIEIQRRLAAQRTETGFAPSVRIGVHSGDVVQDGDDLIGSVVNLASRVTSAAEPDQIMVTEHVADHLERAFVTEDRGIHSLKGVSRPRHLLTVRW